jgi:hypothetical protein
MHASHEFLEWMSVLVFLSSDRSLSDGEDDPAEGAALNQVTQSISRFRQREGRIVIDSAQRAILGTSRHRARQLVRKLSTRG